MESQRNSKEIRNPIRSVIANYQFSIPFFSQNHARDNRTLQAQTRAMLEARRTTIFAFCGRIRQGKNTAHRNNGRKEFVEQLENVTDSDALKGTSWEGMNLFEVK